MLAVLISATQATTKVTTQLRHQRKKGLEKTTKLYFTFLRAMIACIDSVFHVYPWPSGSSTEEMSRRRKNTRMDDSEEDNIDPERPLKRHHPQQQKTDYVSTYDMEIPNRTYRGSNLLLASIPWTVSGITERMLEGNKRNRRLTIHLLAHPQKSKERQKM